MNEAWTIGCGFAPILKAGGVEPPTARVRALNKALGKIPNYGQPLHLWGVPKSLVLPSGGRRMNVRPVALHDPVKAVQKALAARRGKVIHHPADRLSGVYREAWAMGALRERNNVTTKTGGHCERSFSPKL